MWNSIRTTSYIIYGKDCAGNLLAQSFCVLVTGKMRQGKTRGLRW